MGYKHTYKNTHFSRDLWKSVLVCNNMCYHQDYSGDFGESPDHKVTYKVASILLVIHCVLSLVARTM